MLGASEAAKGLTDAACGELDSCFSTEVHAESVDGSPCYSSDSIYNSFGSDIDPFCMEMFASDAPSDKIVGTTVSFGGTQFFEFVRDPSLDDVEYLSVYQVTPGDAAYSEEVDDPELHLPNRFAHVAERGRVRRSATTNVGRDPSGCIPAMEKSSLLRRRITLKKACLASLLRAQGAAEGPASAARGRRLGPVP